TARLALILMGRTGIGLARRGRRGFLGRTAAVLGLLRNSAGANRECNGCSCQQQFASHHSDLLVYAGFVNSMSNAGSVCLFRPQHNALVPAAAKKCGTLPN